MKFTLNWLKDYLETDASLQEITTTLTAIGLEVEEVVNPADGLRQFTVAEVVEAEPHPNADRLRVCKVNTGSETLQIVASNPEQEQAEVTVGVDYHGDNLEIGFNVNYILDVLSVVDNEAVKFTLSDANSSALIEEADASDSVYVVMPMRL